jgi:hypothetical protein
MRARGLALGLLGAALALAAWAAAARAEQWGGIEPGVSTMETVRARWNSPSKETRQKVEGYDTAQWVYEGAAAPGGLKSMTVDFGLLAPAGYRPNVVRLLTLEPKPAIFGTSTVIHGWGEPDAIKGTAKADLSFFYHAGLLVFFDKDDFAFRMIFSVPQPGPPAQPGQRPPAAAPAPPAGAPPRR